MCGILGVATTRGRVLSADRAAVERMRDIMAHRGPDGAGYWSREHVALAHRRLAVLDLSEAAAQPMATTDGRFVIVYSGELYNDAELRSELQALGFEFRTTSDTETILNAFAAWGNSALPRLRGMYAFGLYDTHERTLLLARDPLGIKPLYYAITSARGGEELIFASEPAAVLAHPDIRPRPDLAAVSAYMTTIRTVMGTRTLFDGVRTLRPGQALLFSLGGEGIVVRPLPAPARRTGADTEREEEATARIRATVLDSVRRHLRSDVPICCLLSGGLDSSIVSWAANRELGELWTYCSGAREGGNAAGDALPREDFEFAALVAGRLGSHHTEAPVSRAMFADRWCDMVQAMGVPLSTPNEVAINEVARTLRRDGKIVTLSGEGADELFAGYEAPMLDAARYESILPDAAASAPPHPGHFQLHANAWMPLSTKYALLKPDIWRSIESDQALLEFYRVEFETVAAEQPSHSADPLERLQAHLRFHRAINLSGLLQRLDTATMLAGVEGRTPFADAEVCAAAESLPMSFKLRFSPPHKPATPETSTPLARAETKRILRRAFGHDLPREVVDRPKASFPLPFQAWVADSAPALRGSAFAREIFSPAAIEMVLQNPSAAWRIAWPMVNIAMWGRRWWG